MIFNLFRNFFKKISFLLFVVINSFLFSCSNSINQKNNMQDFENNSIQTLQNAPAEEKYIENNSINKNPVNNSGKKRGWFLGFFVVAAVGLAVALGVTYTENQNEIGNLNSQNLLLETEDSSLREQLSNLNEAVYNSGNVVSTGLDGVSNLIPCSSLYPNCINCNKQNCKVCSPGFSLSNNICTCNVSAMTSNSANCASCSSTTTCDSCNNGYSLSNGICTCNVSAMTSNSANCASCSSPTTCTSCIIGPYYSNGNACLQCGFGCSTCTENACSACENINFVKSQNGNSCTCNSVLNCYSDTSCGVGGCTSCNPAYPNLTSGGGCCLPGQTWNQNTYSCE